MKTYNKEILFWAIVWTILLFVWLFMLVLGLEKAIPKWIEPDDESVELLVVEKPTKKPRFNNLSVLSDMVLPEIEEVKPLEVAEPLHGADLYRFYIAQINEQYYPDVDPYLALAVLELESNYNPNALSSCGAVGLMQLMPQYHSWRASKYCLNDLWDPYTNIIVGMDLLNDLYQASGSWSAALYGYNHSSAYVNAVLARTESLRGGGYFG